MSGGRGLRPPEDPPGWPESRRGYAAGSSSAAERFFRSAALRAVVAVVLALVVLLIGRLGFVRRAEERVLDRRIGLWRQLSEADTQRITLIAVDQETLDDLHTQWPLPRGAYARAIDRLRRCGAAAIGITVVFDGAGGDPRQDQALAAAIGGNDDVVLASRLDLGKQPPTVVLPPFKATTGFCDVPLDDDGVARHFYVAVAGVDPTPFCMALQLLRANYHNPQFNPRGIVDDPGKLYPISWAGKPKDTFRTISMKKVLAGGDIAREVKGNVVLIGSTLPTPSNSIRTPFARGSRSGPPEPPMSTVELTANIVFTLLGSEKLEALTGLEYGTLIFGLVFICFMLFGSLNPLFSLICAAFFGFMYALGATYVMIMSQRLLPMVPPILAIGIAWAAATVYRLLFPMLRRRLPFLQ